MLLTKQDEQEIDQALQVWRQGDLSRDAGLEFLHRADLSRPHSPASVQAAEEVLTNDGEAIETGATVVLDEVQGVVMLSQTCDVVRNCCLRPFVEIAPLIKVDELWVEEIRRLKRPAFAFVPATADEHLVADLDRTMTLEKSLVSRWTRISGWETDDELRDFAHALARKRSRFAFPDDFVAAARRLQTYLSSKHNSQTAEGAYLRALYEIRVRAAPSWDEDEVLLSWWFIKEAEPEGVEVNWSMFLDRWLARFDQTGRFRLDPPNACRLEDMTARDYVESDRLDLDRLSIQA